MQENKVQLKNCDKKSLDKKQIYIVDDDESVCQLMKLYLGTYGFIVDTFSSSAEFLSAVPDNTPGCLILDIHMPGVNGGDMQQTLLDSGCNRPIIIITGDKSDHLKEKILKQGAVGILHKPFHIEELFHMINQIFN
jgi:two-component system response regulator FixJ